MWLKCQGINNYYLLDWNIEIFYLFLNVCYRFYIKLMYVECTHNVRVYYISDFYYPKAYLQTFFFKL